MTAEQKAVVNFARWLLSMPGWWMPTIELLANDMSDKKLIDLARAYLKGPPDENIPDFIRVLANATPGLEANAAARAQVELWEELAEFERGEE